MGIVVIPGCGDIPGWMLRGVDVECYVGWMVNVTWGGIL